MSTNLEDRDYASIQTLYTSISQNASKCGDVDALIYYGNHINYNSFLDEIHACAAGLIANGVKSGDRVSIYLPNIPQCVIAIYAVNMIGAICNMIHPLSTQSELEHAIKISKSEFVLACEINEYLCSNKDIVVILCCLPTYFPKTFKGKIIKLAYNTKLSYDRIIRKKCVPVKNVRKVTEWTTLIADGHKYISEFGIPEVQSNPRDTAVIMYTGGTTGESKGVMLSSTAFNILKIQLYYSIFGNVSAEGDKYLEVLPLFHAFGLIVLHTPLSYGRTCYLLPRFDPKECASLILKEKIQYLMGVPAMYNLMYSRLLDQDLSFIKVIVAGGDSASESSVNRYNQLLKQGNNRIKFRFGYGLTEACSVFSITGDDYNSFTAGWIGKPLIWNELCTVEPGTTNVIPNGQIGELCVRSLSVMNGYYDNPSATADVIKVHEDGKEWLHTGDIVEIDPNSGDIYFKSRYKRMIKVNGYNV
ncbi:MAG TPA: class I adenylate-forming enzyme family protein, partial [Methanocorpusculum sp.]|nr:class I adenylate-forming enzyme family protein [Methanocorpusculum sp.]